MPSSDNNTGPATPASNKPNGTRNAQDFPFYDLSGTPEEIGLQYGQQAAEQIRTSISIYKKAFEQKGVSWERAREIAASFAPQIEAYNPSYLAEITKIAEGADLPREDIIAINARTEILYGQRPQTHAGADNDPDGCTGAIALPSATANGHMIHGQNWDWRDECADSAVVLRISPKGLPRMLVFVEAGILARCGMNSEGIALTGNFLQTERDYGLPGVPVPFIRRSILSAASLAEASRVVFDSSRAFSNNLMLSQKDGEALNLEATPHEIFWIAPENDLLVHANHFISAAAMAKVKDVGLETNTDSLYRDRRVRAHLSAHKGALTIETFKEAFADRYGAPRAVCRSPISGPGGKSSSTVATIIMDTTAGKMWVAKRPYGPHRYTEYSL